MTLMPGFKGIIQDVGGPTANMYGLRCSRWKHGACTDKLCSVDCPSLNADHSLQLELLRRLRALPGIKRAFIGSGIRHDIVLADRSGYLEELCMHHISGQLKIAPEHIVHRVTEYMHKPPVETLDAFRKKFDAVNRERGKEQYFISYLMSGHPGCTIEDMIELAEYIRDHRMYTQQVQDFTPTPMTASTAMYYTCLDPFTMKPVHVPKGREKRIQRAILQYRDARNYSLVREGLKIARREDLIGDCGKCLIPARCH
jgi:uncharacterized radical SAM protein YgiQ